MKKTKRNSPTDLKTPVETTLMEEHIRQRAQQIYQASGGIAGQELDHWLQAEREIKAGENPTLRV